MTSPDGSNDLLTAALRALLPPGQVVELRAPDADLGRGYTATLSGFYDDPQKLVRDAKGIDAPGVYFTLNPVNPPLLARRNNRLKRLDKKDASTADKDITARRWLFVEVDPERPSGICATEGEKAEAGEVADAVAMHLRGAGWPEPMTIDSGNGCYLLYRVDLPTEDDGLVGRCLKALAARFNTPTAHIDTGVFNPSRIARLPGTMNRKGDGTPDRPHRPCRPVCVPDVLTPVPAELLEALAATAPADEKQVTPAAGGGDFADRLLVPQYLAHFGVEVLSTNTGEGGVMRWRVRCPFNPDHAGTDAYVFQYPTGGHGFHCSHNSCGGNKWEQWKAAVGKPLADHYDPPRPIPRPLPPPADADRGAVHRMAVEYLHAIPDAALHERGVDPTLWAARVLVWGFGLGEHEAFALLATYFNPRLKPKCGEKGLQSKTREAADRPFNKPKGWLLDAANPYAEFPMPRAAGRAADGRAPTPPPPRAWEQHVQAGEAPKSMSAVELADKDFPPPKWAIEGLLPEGLTVLGGAPKVGKSWVSLLVGWAVAAGGTLDGRPVTAGDVLYLALEDTYRRLQDRLFTLRKGVEFPIPERLTLAIHWPRADADGLAHIAEWIEARKSTARLVIVDTLAMFRKVQNGKGNNYAEDYEAVGGLKKLVDYYGVCGMINHHTRKQKSADPFDDISGTQGLAGSADSMWVLDADPSGQDAKLFVKGRDLPRGTVPLTFDTDTCRWQFGELAEGIHAHGRGETPTTSRANAAESWLREFLRAGARTATAIDQAGVNAGFSERAVQNARTKLGKTGTREVTNVKYGKAGVWWCGLGPESQWCFPEGVTPPYGWRGATTHEPHRRDLDGGREEEF